MPIGPRRGYGRRRLTRAWRVSASAASLSAHAQDLAMEWLAQRPIKTPDIGAAEGRGACGGVKLADPHPPKVVLTTEPGLTPNDAVASLQDIWNVPLVQPLGEVGGHLLVQALLQGALDGDDLIGPDVEHRPGCAVAADAVALGQGKPRAGSRLLMKQRQHGDNDREQRADPPWDIAEREEVRLGLRAGLSRLFGD